MNWGSALGMAEAPATSRRLASCNRGHLETAHKIVKMILTVTFMVAEQTDFVWT